MGMSGHSEGIRHEEGEGPGAGATLGEDNAMVDHLHLLVQGMRQLQQLQMNRKDHGEAEAVKGSVELQRMPEPGDAAVEFNDWMYITEQQLGALTDNASSWFSKCLSCAREAYVRYQGASALERLSVTPVLTEDLKGEKWFRLERRVLSLLLAAMPKAVREDTITHRVESVAGVLFRLHVIYQPGGTMERTAILKHLEGAPGSDDPGEVVAQLRRWRRYLARAEEMSIALPDASLQLRGIELIVAKVLEKFADVKFRLALARNELRLSSSPTSDTVLKYYQHALAELQQVTPNVKNNQEGARLKGASANATTSSGTGGSGSPTASPKRGKNPCKFFQSEAGCKRGANCSFAHEFLSKADRKQRCWTCGAAGHRQQNCPTVSGEGGKGGGKHQGQTSSAPSTSTVTAASMQSASTEATQTAQATSTAASSTTTSATSPPTGDETAAHREEMKKLLKEASSMLSKIQLMAARVEDTNKATEDLELLLSPVSAGEFDQATNVGVELADGQMVELRQTTTDEALRLIAEIEDKSLEKLQQAGLNYLKALPVNRKARRRLQGSRWIVHLYDGKNETASEELKKLETENAVVLEIDLQRSKVYNMTGWSNIMRALLWAGCRGQLEGLLGGPPRKGGDELRHKLMYLWMVAERGAAIRNLRRPFLFMEYPGKMDFWSLPEWRNFRDEYQLSHVEVNAGHGHVFHGATNMNFRSYFKNTEIPKGDPPTTWTTAFMKEILEGVKEWIRWPDQVRQAQLLCKMDGSLEEMSERELKQWAKHVRDGHVPFNKRCRTCVTNAGIDADGKYRYALVGSYCMPRLEGYKDVVHYTQKLMEDVIQVQYTQKPMEDVVQVQYTQKPMEDVIQEDDGFLAEEEEPEPFPEEDRMDLDQKNEDYCKMYKEVFDQVDVNAAMRRMYLQVRQEGHPITRVHSDRARELKSAALRQWLYEKDVWITTGESQTPQQNGRAEAMVRSVKRYAKVLLGASSLPRECWPLAMSYAAQRQRKRSLGQPTTKDPTFGARVAVKSKVFGTGGSYDLDPRREGRFVGYSSDVKNGLVVRYDDGTFVTSCHVREGLVDAEALADDGPVEVELPMPERRLRTKARLALITNPYEDIEAYAKELDVEEMYEPGDVLNLWEKLKTIPRPTRRGARSMVVKDNGGSFYAGCYTHGGVCGIMKLTRQLPNVTAYLVKAAKEMTGNGNFGSVAVVETVSMAPHRDSHNQEGTLNTVTALTDFSNGQVWAEKKEVDYSHGDVWRETRPGQWKRGVLHELAPGKAVSFPPGQWHQTEPWEGRRVVLLTYTPRLTHLSEENEKELRGLGFDLPPREDKLPRADEDEASPSMFTPPREEDETTWYSGLARLNEDQKDLLEELQERATTLRRLLEEEEILLKEYRRMGRQVTEEASHTHQLLIDMIEQTADEITRAEREEATCCLKGIMSEPSEGPDVEDIEKHLSELEGELQVVLNVPLDQVKKNIQVWLPAIDKELEVLFKKGGNATLRKIPLKEAKERERRGELTIVPSKLVFTCKPPNQGEAPKAQDGATPKEGKARWRRKCRLVLCGNFAERPEGQSQAELYAAGASADSMRVALTLASVCYWAGAGSDINGAFLLAPWPKHMRRYATVPAKTFIMAKRASEDEAWEVDRALYGLRESPAVWSDFRRQRLKGAKVPWKNGHLVLKATIVDPEVWMILYCVEGASDVLAGVLVTYVDDLLYLAEEQVIITVHAWLCEEWPSSPLEWTTDGTKYLGVEIVQREGHFLIPQRGYLESLVRSYDLEPGEHVHLPCPREWLVDDGDDEQATDQEEYTPEELKRAQKVTGELLWVTRARPDILFVVTMMASALTKRPCHVYRVGMKVMAYLAASVEVQLQLGGRQPVQQSQTAAAATDPQAPQHCANIRLRLEGFSDASFAPFGGRSYGASAISLNGSVVSWKCGKQAFTTMSVAEAELYEAAQTTLLMKGIHALISEIVSEEVPQALYVDNSASVSLIGGCQGSWRTRHLKVRCSFITDMVQKGELMVNRISGRFQLADLPTKLHGKVRLAELMGLWGFVGGPLAGINNRVKVATLLYLIVALQATPTEATEVKEAGEKGGVKLAGLDELTLVTLLVCIAAVSIWELLKRITCWMLGIREETTKERRLRRLETWREPQLRRSWIASA
ncbi:RE1 [Symbiodinium sp. CCMP2456]|nr:RE1 [Symbiodinium sp. CCMP2456]